MRDYLFTVIFKTGVKELVYAFNVQSAIILAQARQIQQGNLYDVDYVIDEDDKIIKETKK